VFAIILAAASSLRRAADMIALYKFVQLCEWLLVVASSSARRIARSRSTLQDVRLIDKSAWWLRKNLGF
jgi:hypothetical protein